MTHNAHQLQPCFILCFPIEKTIVNHLNIMFLQRRHENKQFPPVLFLIKTFFHFNSQVLLKNKKGFRLFVVLVAVRSHFTLTDLLWFSHAVRGVSGKKKKRKPMSSYHQLGQKQNWYLSGDGVSDGPAGNVVLHKCFSTTERGDGGKHGIIVTTSDRVEEEFCCRRTRIW